MFGKLALAGALAATGMAVCASGAVAFSLSGGAYGATATSANTATVGGGAYAMSCSTATFAGEATGAATTKFVAIHDGCSFFGYPATVTQSGDWEFTVTSTDGAGTYYGRLDIPAGASSTTSIPLAGCTVTVTGPQSVSGILSSNYIGGLNVSAYMSGMSYTAFGCPFGSGSDLSYSTGVNPITVPGITVS